VTWVVVGRQLLREFVEKEGVDDVLVVVLTAWLLYLQVSGPPADGVYDPDLGIWSVDIPGLPVNAEYLVLPHLAAPAIVMRRFRLF
jgi:hypothetical protein